MNFINGMADYIFTTGESVRIEMIKSNRINPKIIESIPTGIAMVFEFILYLENSRVESFLIRGRTKYKMYKMHTFTEFIYDMK